MYQGKSNKGNRKGKGNCGKGNGDMQIIAVLLLCTMLCGTAGKANDRRQGKIIGYTYDSGSTVTEMAKRCCPDGMDIREVAREIEEINGIEDHIVYANVVYKVPVYKGK